MNEGSHHGVKARRAVSGREKGEREEGERERSQASQMLFNRTFGRGVWGTKNMEKQIALWVEGKESLS